MPVRFIGRPPFWKGRTIYEICCLLKNFGAGRVVTRWSFNNRYPEKSYFVLNRVEPDLTDPEMKKGACYGHAVFRGVSDPEEVFVGGAGKADWVLIPKEEEATFCSLTETDTSRPINVVPSHIDSPPLLEWLYKQRQAEEGNIIKGKIRLKLTPLTTRNNRFIQEDSPLEDLTELQ